MRISPAVMAEEAPSTSSSFLYSLLQTLDHEPPLSDENDNPAENPAQDKYRILAHDMIRGLVDPGLKPDRKELAPREESVEPELPSVDRGEGPAVALPVHSCGRAQDADEVPAGGRLDRGERGGAGGRALEQWKKRSPIVRDQLKICVIVIVDQHIPRDNQH